MPVRLEDGFLGKRIDVSAGQEDIGNQRGDMYEIALWEESIVKIRATT